LHGLIPSRQQFQVTGDWIRHHATSGTTEEGVAPVDDDDMYEHDLLVHCVDTTMVRKGPLLAAYDDDDDGAGSTDGVDPSSSTTVDSNRT
jgi:hypothetical protein